MEHEDFHTAQGPSRIVVADDHPLFRSVVRDTLEKHPNLEVVAEASDGHQALQMCRRHRPDLVLMDLGMPVMDGVAATRAIKEESPEIHVLVLTAIDESRGLSNALEAGAEGYVLKDACAERLVDAVFRVLSGHSPVDEELAMRLIKSLMNASAKEEKEVTVEGSAPEATLQERGGSPSDDDLLTPREVEVLRLLVQGQTNQQIATNLLISTSTVKSHMRHIGEKLGVCDRVQAAVKAVELGLLDERGGG